MYERHKARVYTCGLCGRSVTLLPERRGYGAPGYYLPNGWTGSHRRRGCCLCPECSEAVRAEKERCERLHHELRYSVAQRDMTHAVPDSFGRIADELDEIVDAASHADDTCERLADLAERIRKLAKEGEHGND